MATCQEQKPEVWAWWFKWEVATSGMFSERFPIVFTLVKLFLNVRRSNVTKFYDRATSRSKSIFKRFKISTKLCKHHSCTSYGVIICCTTSGSLRHKSKLERVSDTFLLLYFLFSQRNAAWYEMFEWNSIEFGKITVVWKIYSYFCFSLVTFTDTGMSGLVGVSLSHAPNEIIQRISNYA